MCAILGSGLRRQHKRRAVELVFCLVPGHITNNLPNSRMSQGEYCATEMLVVEIQPHSVTNRLSIFLRLVKFLSTPSVRA